MKDTSDDRGRSWHEKKRMLRFYTYLFLHAFEGKNKLMLERNSSQLWKHWQLKNERGQHIHAYPSMPFHRNFNLQKNWTRRIFCYTFYHRVLLIYYCSFIFFSSVKHGLSLSRHFVCIVASVVPSKVNYWYFVAKTLSRENTLGFAGTESNFLNNSDGQGEIG